MLCRTRSGLQADIQLWVQYGMIACMNAQKHCNGEQRTVRQECFLHSPAIGHSQLPSRQIWAAGHLLSHAPQKYCNVTGTRLDCSLLCWETKAGETISAAAGKEGI